MRPKHAFTLVEMLVVIGILAVLLGIFMPTIGKVRESGNRIACAAHLSEIGHLFEMYLNDSKGKLPRVNTLPSQQPPLNDAPSIVQLLDPYPKDTKEVWHCPSDRITKDEPGLPNAATYFEREGSSYQYNTYLSANFAGLQIKDALRLLQQNPKLVFIMSECEPFHAPPGTPKSANYLFPDMHVGDMID